MLHRSVYQLLPYVYITLGVLCLLVVDSQLIWFSSALLFAAGGLVLWMRHRNSVDPVEYISTNEACDDDMQLSSEDIRDHERRFGDEREFPLIDDNGAMIAFDRRTNNQDKSD